MATLVKRATPAQRRIHAAIAGAVRNAADAHPDWVLSHPKAAGSIAKRATGTLTAGWPDVLALRDSAASERPSERLRPDDQCATGFHGARRGAGHCVTRSPLRVLRGTVGAMAGHARREGNDARLIALEDVLREIATLMATERP